jgi:hypothetical protein
MNKIVVSIVGALFLLMCIFRCLYALLYPDKFAKGARKVLFIDARQKSLFPPVDKDDQPDTKTVRNNLGREFDPGLADMKFSRTGQNDKKQIC